MRARGATIVTTVGLLLGAGGVIVLAASPPTEVKAEVGTVLDGSAEPADSVAPASTAHLWPAVPDRPAVESFVPDRLVVPSIDIDAPLTATGVGEDGAFVPPEHPAELGWWSGVRPGAGAGSVLVAGHLDARRYGQGPLARIVDLRPGDLATVTGSGATRRTYVVRGVSTFPKDALPAADLFGSDGPERLVLVTCGGTFSQESRHWDSNVVAVLDPVVPTAR